jgi:nanoRNase/pAp phosphatase (c-di-AMP/oligoRNAs hydrolase)
MMPFQFNGKLWTVSLYTTKEHIDVSQIAKKRGGGGHKQAAGFQVQKIEDLLYGNN